MPDSWQKEYAKLTNFIVQNPDIKIKPDIVSIPERLRLEFYQLYDAARDAFVEQRFAALLGDVVAINASYNQVEEDILKHSGLEAIVLPAYLRKFLEKPVKELTKTLSNSLFNLLKGRIDIKSFERQALKDIETKLKEFLRLVYEKWIVINIVKLLEPYKSLTVSAPQRQLVAVEPDEDSEVYIYATHSPVPVPQDSGSISFEHERYPVLTIPDFIIHSTRINRFVAFRSEYIAAMSLASDHSTKHEWYPLGSKLTLLPRSILIYIADTPEEISLVADSKMICRPDLVLECIDQEEWFEKYGAEALKPIHNHLRPKLGTYVICREGVADEFCRELEAIVIGKSPDESEVDEGEKPSTEQDSGRPRTGIHILNVGLDSSKLEPVVSALTKHDEDLIQLTNDCPDN